MGTTLEQVAGAETREQRALNAFLAECFRDGMDGQQMAAAMLDVLRQGGHIDEAGQLVD